MSHNRRQFLTETSQLAAGSLLGMAALFLSPISYRLTPISYLLLNWNRFRAPGWPGFFRSTARGSRVNKP